MKTPYILLIIFMTQSLAAQSIYDVSEFGATGNKEQLATTEIQAAIDQCFKDGGGTVYFPPGDYLSGTITLKSNINLHLEAGATLYASQREKDYDVPFDIYKGSNPDTDVLIYANEAKSIAITGRGMIHGQARRVYRELEGVDSFIAEETENARAAGVEMKRYYKIPPIVNLVYLVSCEDVKIEDVTLYESVGWTLHLQWSQRVTINNIYIYSDLASGVNADGIDVDGCKNVMISNCRIETGDDAIVLKTTLTNNHSESCESITVNNCVLTSTSTALKLGTESYSDFRHIVFSNCVIRNTNRGLGIIVRDGATVENVLFSNITIDTDRKHFNWWGNGDPIWLVVLKRNQDSKVGTIRNIVFENIIAHGQGTSKLEGFSGHYLHNILLNNVKLFMHPEDKPDKRTHEALSAHEIMNLQLNDVQIYWDEQIEEKWSEAIHLNNIQGLTIADFSGRQGIKNSNLSVIHLKNCQDVKIINAEAQAGAKILCSIQGSKSANIHLINSNILNHADELLETGIEVDKNQINLMTD